MPALIWLSYLSLLILSLLDNIRGPFFPDILVDLQLNGFWGSTFFATTSLFAFFGSWSSHRIVQRKSSLYLMTLASVVLALGFGAVARAHDLYTLLPFCALFGWAFGALNLAQNVMVFEASAPHQRRRRFSGLHSMYGLAALAAPLVASLFRGFGMNWRGSFGLLAFLPLLAAGFSRGMHGRGPVREPHGAKLNAKEWLKCALFSVMMSFYLWGEISITTRMVQWLRGELNFTPDQANLYLALFCVALLAGRILFSFVHFKRFENWHILFLSSVLSAFFYLLGLELSPLWFVACGLTLAPFFPLAMEQVAVSFGNKSTEALGFVLGVGSLSVVAMHLTLGALTDAFGVGRALLVGPVSLFIVTVILLARMARQKSR